MEAAIKKREGVKPVPAETSILDRNS
jgi:hypothetical protein